MRIYCAACDREMEDYGKEIEDGTVRQHYSCSCQALEGFFNAVYVIVGSEDTQLVGGSDERTG